MKIDSVEPFRSCKRGVLSYMHLSMLLSYSKVVAILKLLMLSSPGTLWSRTYGIYAKFANFLR